MEAGMAEAGWSSQSFCLCVYRMGRTPTAPRRRVKATHSSSLVVFKKSKPALLTSNPGASRHPGKHFPALLPLPAPR